MPTVRNLSSLEEDHRRNQERFSAAAARAGRWGTVAAISLGLFLGMTGILGPVGMVGLLVFIPSAIYALQLYGNEYRWARTALLETEKLKEQLDGVRKN